MRTYAEQHVFGVDVVGDGLDPVWEQLGVVDQCAVGVPPDRPAIVQVDVLVCGRGRRVRWQKSGGCRWGTRAAPHSPRRAGRTRPSRPQSLEASPRPAAHCRAIRSRRSGSTSSCAAPAATSVRGADPANDPAAASASASSHPLNTHQPMAGPETPRPLSSADASSSPTPTSNSTSACIVTGSASSELVQPVPGQCQTASAPTRPRSAPPAPRSLEAVHRSTQQCASVRPPRSIRCTRLDLR